MSAPPTRRKREARTSAKEKCAAKANAYLTYKVTDGVLGALEKVEIVLRCSGGSNAEPGVHGADHGLDWCDKLKYNEGIARAGRRLLEHGFDMNKTVANQAWKDDAASKPVAVRCGMAPDKVIGARNFTNWEMHINRERAKSTGVPLEKPERDVGFNCGGRPMRRTQDGVWVVYERKDVHVGDDEPGQISVTGWDHYEPEPTGDLSVDSDVDPSWDMEALLWA